MPSKALLFLLVGLPASGKSTEARRLEETERALRLSSDECMIPLFGRDDPDSKRNVVEAQLISIGFRAVQLGLNVVLDLGLWSRDERSALVWLAEELGVQPKIVYLPIDPATQLERSLRRLAKDPDQVYPVSVERFESFLDYFQEPTPEEISGAAQYQPPPGWVGWSEWAMGRWPSLPHVDRMRTGRD
ncbi:AAA family ATPase [Paenarthrobacter aromaticivorans]|uniref:ATP-binding protein n=1 Tax=Paenarthrobacter aromaticivorans TaxID=2849150 RepID=A0ABS6IAR4_9MICC|nr:ATP-binding protein [Paenarthrobacter sp. MMS21-TAE1-1]MBU8868510.1 ATP-binding protein [Paenarthrobacter sp. MMS21-TAE1-1]